MARVNNPTLGTIACSDCGGQADVCQTQRGKGRFLYTRCPDCGTDQRTGAAVQTRLYYQTTWKDGIEVAQPQNLKVQEPESEPVIEPETTEPEPVVEPADNLDPTRVEPKPEPKGKGGGLALLAGLLAMVFIPFGGGR